MQDHANQLDKTHKSIWRNMQINLMEHANQFDKTCKSVWRNMQINLMEHANQLDKTCKSVWRNTQIKLKEQAKEIDGTWITFRLNGHFALQNATLWHDWRSCPYTLLEHLMRFLAMLAVSIHSLLDPLMGSCSTQPSCHHAQVNS